MSSVDTKCTRCGKREYYAALIVQWGRGNSGEDADSDPAFVCRRCSSFFLDKWDALVAEHCIHGAYGDEDEDE